MLHRFLLVYTVYVHHMYKIIIASKLHRKPRIPWTSSVGVQTDASIYNWINFNIFCSLFFITNNCILLLVWFFLSFCLNIRETMISTLLANFLIIFYTYIFIFNYLFSEDFQLSLIYFLFYFYCDTNSFCH